MQMTAAYSDEWMFDTEQFTICRKAEEYSGED